MKNREKLRGGESGSERRKEMEFTVIRGYFYFGEVIPCKFLAVKDRHIKKGITPGEFGTIENGVFTRGTVDVPDIMDIWYIDTMQDMLCCTRAPQEGEVHLKVNPSFDRWSPYREHADCCGEFEIQSDGENVTMKSVRPGDNFKKVFPVIER